MCRMYSKSDGSNYSALHKNSINYHVHAVGNPIVCDLLFRTDLCHCHVAVWIHLPSTDIWRTEHYLTQIAWDHWGIMTRMKLRVSGGQFEIAVIMPTVCLCVAISTVRSFG